MDKPSPPHAVFNAASWLNVIGYSIAGWLILPIMAWSMVTDAAFPYNPLSWVGTALPLGYLGYIFFSFGKSVTITNHAIIIELWLSQLLRLNRKTVIPWEDIRQVEYRAKEGSYSSSYALVLEASNGRWMFASPFFDTKELRQLKAILAKRLGSAIVKITPVIT